MFLRTFLIILSIQLSFASNESVERAFEQILSASIENESFDQVFSYRKMVHSDWYDWAEYGEYDDDPEITSQLIETTLNEMTQIYEMTAPLETGESFVSEEELSEGNQQVLPNTFNSRSVDLARRDARAIYQRYLQENSDFNPIYVEPIRFRMKQVCTETQVIQTLEERYRLRAAQIFRVQERVAVNRESIEEREVQIDGEVVDRSPVRTPLIEDGMEDIVETDTWSQNDEIQHHYLSEDAKCTKFRVMVRAEIYAMPDISTINIQRIVEHLVSNQREFTRNLRERIEKLTRLIHQIKTIQFVMPQRIDISELPRELQETVMGSERFQVILEHQIPVANQNNYGLADVFGQDLLDEFFNLPENALINNPSSHFVTRNQSIVMVNFFAQYIARNLQQIQNDFVTYKRYYSDTAFNRNSTDRIDRLMNRLVSYIYSHVRARGHESDILFAIHNENPTIMLHHSQINQFLTALADIAGTNAPYFNGTIARYGRNLPRGIAGFDHYVRSRHLDCYEGEESLCQELGVSYDEN